MSNILQLTGAQKGQDTMHPLLPIGFRQGKGQVHLVFRVLDKYYNLSLTNSKSRFRNILKRASAREMPTHEDVEVGVVFLPDKTAEKFFGRRRQVVFIADLVAGLRGTPVSAAGPRT